jgi:hypothetical protein
MNNEIGYPSNNQTRDNRYDESIKYRRTVLSSFSTTPPIDKESYYRDKTIYPKRIEVN